MPKRSKEQQQLLEMLRTTYQEVYALEEELCLRVSQQDNRIRIDYFYDALRALTDEELPLTWRQQRLSVEWLAYDAVAIRYLEHHPQAALKPNDQHYSADNRLIVVDAALPSKALQASRAQKNALKKAYLRFGVLFVALFKPFADRDHRDKKEEMEEQISALAQLENAVEKLALGEMSIQQVRDVVALIDDPSLRAKLEALLTDTRYHDPQTMKAALTTIRYAFEAEDKDYKEMEDAHMTFLTAQLGLYEQAKDLVKELAGQGLNLAGQHLDQAMSQSTDLGQGVGR